MKKILILSPHTDDGGFGCGGTINKLIVEGNDVYYVAFSPAKERTLALYPSEVLVNELKEASHELGLKAENLILLNYEVRTFNFQRQEILDDIIRLRTQIQPDLVFIPALTDIHQDHKTVAEEALRAFKFTTILSYELPWNNISFQTSCFYKLSKKNIESKVNALQKFQSQANRRYANTHFIESLASIRGVQINTVFAETFEVIRWIN